MASPNDPGPWTRLSGRDDVFSTYKRDESAWGYRTCAVRLSDGSTLVLSPTRGLGSGVHDALVRIGPPSVLLAPNHYHHLGVPEFLERYRTARPAATHVATPRLETKSRISFASIGTFSRSLPSGVSVLEPEGLRSGEAWLRIQRPSGVAWVVADAFFNVSERVRGLTGTLLRATKTIPGLCIGDTFRWFGTRERRLYREWLIAQIAKDEPDCLVPAHGECADGPDLPTRLRELAMRRL